jgi:hypothetical protein
MNFGIIQPHLVDPAIRRPVLLQNLLNSFKMHHLVIFSQAELLVKPPTIVFHFPILKLHPNINHFLIALHN